MVVERVITAWLASAVVMQLDSQELADCLDLRTGLYHIKPDELNKATKINCCSLIPPVRRHQRTKQSSGTSRNIKCDQLVKTVDGSRQHVIEASGSNVEPC